MKIEHLTFTRFVAALLVVFFHLGATRLGSDSIAGSLLGVGNSAVSYFFVLSGFILVVSNGRQGHLPARIDRAPFWRNRFARIYPLYLFALVLTLAFGWLTHSNVTGEMSIGSVLASVLLVQAWVPPVVMQLNYPGWSLSVETLFYLLFPLLYGAMLRQSTRQLLLATGIVWALSLAVYANMINGVQVGAANWKTLHNLTLYFPPLHLSTFVTGILTGIVFVRHRAWLNRHRGWLTTVFATTLAISLWAVLGHLPMLNYHHDGLFAPLFALFILWLSGQANGLTRWLSRPLPVRLGEISYGIYLLQVPVGIATFYLNYHWLYWPVWVYLPLYVGLLCGVAAVCYRYIEQPARRLIRQLTTPVQATTPTDETLSHPAR